MHDPEHWRRPWHAVIDKLSSQLLWSEVAMNIEFHAIKIHRQLRRAGLRSILGGSAVGYWIAAHPIEKDWTVSDLAYVGGTDPSTISRCLRQLLELGLVEESKREGRTVFYRFTRAAYRMGFPRKYKDAAADHKIQIE